MTVVPQQYTLHCVTVGDGSYDSTLYGNEEEIYTIDCENGNGDCVRKLLHSSNSTYDNIFNITWDTQTISSGPFNKSVNGDQMYKCHVYRSNINRNQYLTVKGIIIILHIFTTKYFKLLSSLLLLLKSTRQVLLSLSVGQLIQLMLMDM